MRLHILAAGVAAAALLPSLAFAQSSCEQQRSNRVLGTVAGGGIGAVLGSAIAGQGHKTDGAVVGALGGALLGNQLAKAKEDCARAYGYYDTNGSWHANGVDRSAAAGYYDRNGNWVDGAPNGFYDTNGNWVTASGSASANGYYDSNGRWVPASAQGYYDDNGQWVERASGYYDSNGHWIAGSTSGRYDINGHWLAGASSGHRDANGVWIADAQPGYYDADGRWRQGASSGYYDVNGRWVSASVRSNGPGYNGPNYNDREPQDIRARFVWLDQRIRSAQSDRMLTAYQAQQDMRTLASIRQSEARMRHRNGRLNQRDEASIQAKLDRLSANLRIQTRH